MENKVKTNVTVFIEVYNEELRIESCLQSFLWADEIILFDKHSTDKTKEIATKLGAQVVLVPYCEASENTVNNLANRKSEEWCLFPTASSLMSPRLAEEIVRLTSNTDFQYDVIGLPYRFYTMGICNPRTPFYTSHKNILIRRSTLAVSTLTHKEFSSTSTKVFNINPINQDMFLYHLTHQSAESFWYQTIRYAKSESVSYQNISVLKCLFDIFKAIYVVLFRKRTLLMGIDGLAISLAYISYFVVRFTFAWEKKQKKDGKEVYHELRNKIYKALIK